MPPERVRLRSRAWTARSLQLAGRLVPGIGRVRAQVEPFAGAWRAANEQALTEDGPLWVALGDSMTQGIGASDIAGGWVGQLQARYAAAGTPVRVVNLSVTGARIADVLDQQLPQLALLGQPVDLVTVLVGANDMVVRSRRAAAAASMAALLEALPQSSIVATLPRRNDASLAINRLIDEAAGQGRIHVADTRGRTVRSLVGTRADDHFHPNERGYGALADTFDRAIRATGLLV